MDCVIPFKYGETFYHYCVQIDDLFQCATDELYNDFDECYNGNIYFETFLSKFF